MLVHDHELCQAFGAHSFAAGRINVCSQDHIGLLHLETFNVSIPKEHFPKNKYTFAAGVFNKHVNLTDTDDTTAISTGSWIDNQTGDMLGGETGDVRFTVRGFVDISYVGDVLEAYLV